MNTDSFEDRAQRIITRQNNADMKAALQRLSDRGDFRTVVIFDSLVTLTNEHGYPPTLRELEQPTSTFHTGIGRYHMPKLETEGLVTVARTGQRVGHRGWHPVKPENYEPPEADIPPERTDPDLDAFGTNEGPAVFLVEGPMIREV